MSPQTGAIFTRASSLTCLLLAALLAQARGGEVLSGRGLPTTKTTAFRGASEVPVTAEAALPTAPAPALTDQGVQFDPREKLEIPSDLGSESDSEVQLESRVLSENEVQLEEKAESLLSSNEGHLRGGRRLAALDKEVHCACRVGAGNLKCVRMFYSLLQCNPLCSALCAGQGMQFQECSGSRSRLWHSRLHVKYTPCI